MIARCRITRILIPCPGHGVCSLPVVSGGAQSGERFVSADPDVEARARIRAAIVLHLQQYPLAGDTTEGMIACWMPAEIASARHVVEEVVEAMVRAGELLAQPLPDYRVLYKRGPRI